MRRTASVFAIALVFCASALGQAFATPPTLEEIITDETKLMSITALELSTSEAWRISLATAPRLDADNRQRHSQGEHTKAAALDDSVAKHWRIFKQRQAATRRNDPWTGLR
jgi:hypothetical protein